MRIDPKPPVPPVAAKPVREQAAPKAQEDPAAVVELSGAGVAADAARRSSEARVSEIRVQIERGTYQVDMEKLAARLAEQELILT